MPPPQFLFLDVDGTIIGDILPQIAEWEILRQFEKTRIPQFKKNLNAQLQNGLLRPYFATFIDTMKENNQDIEFFIYTASEPVWANFIVNAIEKCTGVKFNRPLFTRTHCFKNKYQKTLHTVASLAYSKHTNKCKSVNDFFSNSLLIDNNHVLSKQEESKLILCPTYNYKDTYDVLRLVSENVLVENYVEISRILYQYGLFPKIYTDFSYQVFKSLYFSLIGNLIKENLKNKFPRDTFWLNISVS